MAKKNMALVASVPDPSEKLCSVLEEQMITNFPMQISF